LERIAAIRADGASWDKTAEQLKTTAAELEALVKTHKYLFRRIMFRADREVAREDRRIARVVFRKQIGLDPTTQAARLSAQCLVNIDLTYYRHRNKKTPFYGLDPADPKLQEALRRIESESSMTPEHREELLAHIVERGHIKLLVKRHPEWFPYLPPEIGPDYPPGSNPVPRNPKPPEGSG